MYYMINKNIIIKIKNKIDVDIIYTQDKVYVCKKDSIAEFSSTQLKYELAPIKLSNNLKERD